MTASLSTDDFEPTSRTFVSQGLKLHYLDWGNAGAPILLMVHGVRDQARSWDWTARALRSHWRVIALDLRGHGDSQWSPDGAYLSSYHVLDLVNLVDELGDGPLTIIGHSFGGGVVTRYAALYPQRVSRLVLIEGLGPSPPVLENWARMGPVRRTRDWIEKRRNAAAAKPRRMAGMADTVARMKAANPQLSEEQVQHLAAHGSRRHADGYSWKYDPLVGNFVPEDFTLERPAFWREIGCPALLLYGSESWTTDPAKDGRADCFADQRSLVFEGAGHWLHHDQFDRFISELKGFL